MTEPKRITTPLEKTVIAQLRAGDEVLVSGTIYTARDIAHKRLCEALDNGKPLPFELDGAVIFYVGPSPAGEGRAIGSAGPTTSARMDEFTGKLLEQNLAATIGKGTRGDEVIEALQRYKAVHLSAVGGAGALLSKTIKASEVIAYKELGTEAIRRLTVEDFPAVVAYDCRGNSVYQNATG